MENKLSIIKQNFLNDLDQVNSIKDLKDLELNYFSKKGSFSLLMQGLKDVSPEQRPLVGKLINDTKVELLEKFSQKEQFLKNKELEEKYEKESINFKYDSTIFLKGSIHPLNLLIEDFYNYFTRNGFEFVQGPEVETDEFNFEYMNIPKDHPARGAQDSFYFNPNLLLRTHTSPVQARTMLLKKGEEIKLVCPGKVYRRDEDDQTHSHQFHQLEGLVVGKNITFANMIQTIKDMLENIFEKNSEIRLRPSYFPFTEPSCEIDVMYTYKNGDKKFIEIMGAGLVHPNVLKMCGYDPEIYSGFAFGIGIERVAMIKYEIDEIREFYTNDLRFLKQF